MKVLVISHNPFCKTNNMGKTLSSYFTGFDKKDIAQIFIVDQNVELDICNNFFKITDKSVLKSIISRKSGEIIDLDFKQDEKTTIKNEKTSLNKFINKIKGSWFGYFLRNLCWKLGKWDTPLLNKWIDDFNPDIIFFASGDYKFMYELTLKIAIRKEVPVIPLFVDDYFFYNKLNKNLFGKLVYKSFVKSVNKIVEYSSQIAVISEKMKIDYEKQFSKKCFVLHTFYENKMCNYEIERNSKILYIGNLSLGRYKSLIELGKCLKNFKINGIPLYIDVYSTEENPNVIKQMNMENGIVFHGAIDSFQVEKELKSCMLCIFVESFETQFISRVKYSISTKIPESLISNSCILAYGPSNIASMDYLHENNAAYCINNKNDLNESIEKILYNDLLRKEIVDNATKLFYKNHSIEGNNILKKVIYELCK